MITDDSSLTSAVVVNKNETDREDDSLHNKKPIPVTVLSGFLGSGKTTLLKYILESNEHNLTVAVIVNDMAELNIDAAALVNHQGSSIVQTEREVISLQNGCICCTLRGDLIREIARIKSCNDFDYVLIESTGIAEPQAVAQAFVFDPSTAELAESEENMLWTQARLDTCVTVVDAHSFSNQMASLQQFGERYDDEQCWVCCHSQNHVKKQKDMGNDSNQHHQHALWALSVSSVCTVHHDMLTPTVIG